METKFRKSFEKDIDKINSQDVLNDIANVIENIENAKRPQDIANIKKMKGNKNAFRIRIGRYRIGIFIVNETVEFTRVLARDKIYKYFPD
jgi:mRNA-degrading endonuclease RelE of RelBE toxin-antitoxin system